MRPLKEDETIYLQALYKPYTCKDASLFKVVHLTLHQGRTQTTRGQTRPGDGGLGSTHLASGIQSYPLLPPQTGLTSEQKIKSLAVYSKYRSYTCPVSSPVGLSFTSHFADRV